MNNFWAKYARLEKLHKLIVVHLKIYFSLSEGLFQVIYDKPYEVFSK